VAVEVAMHGEVCGGSGGKFGGGSGGIGSGIGDGDGSGGVARVRVRVVVLAIKVAVVPVGREMTVAHLPLASFFATFLGSTTFHIQKLFNA
jgi:hypothetical protein